jgi:hypothetical protein
MPAADEEAASSTGREGRRQARRRRAADEEAASSGQGRPAAGASGEQEKPSAQGQLTVDCRRRAGKVVCPVPGLPRGLSTMDLLVVRRTLSS